MSQQIQITGGAKVRDLNDVIIGTNGVLSSLAFNVANGVPKLDSNGKILVSQLPNSVMEYLGTWNAATNTPTLVNGVGNQGDVYLCNVAGTVNFGAGPITFAVGDTAIYSGSIWQKAGGATGTVTSVGLSTSGNAFTIGSSPVTTSGTITINGAGTASQYINGAGNLTTFPTLITSIGLSMPSAFSVSNSPLTANGTISVTGAGTVSQYIDGTGALQSFPSLTGYVPYVGATTDVDLGVHVLNAQALHVKGTAGAGHLGLKHQTATPTGSANESLVFANVDGDLGWQNGNLYSTILNTHSNTANRVYTFPNASGTLALTSDINYPVTSVFGRTGAVTAQSGDYTTTLVTEGTNLYYTDARARGALSFTAGSGAYNSTTGVITIPTNNNQITNGANYITLTSLSATTPLSYNNTTGAFSISQASTSTNGYLTSTDWNTFNNKQNTITTGNLTEATSSVLTITGGTGSVIGSGTTIAVKQSSSTQSGYLSSTDWNTFNNKAAALNGTGFVKASGTVISYDNSTYYLASNPSNYITLTSLAATSPLVYNNLSGGFSITQATTSTNGYLSSTDWNTFNNKQSALTNPITGTGTTGQVTFFNGTTSVTSSSNLFWDNTNGRLGVGNSTPSYTLDVSGTGRFSGAVQMGNSSQVMGGGILKLGIASGNAGAALQLLGWSSFPNWQIDTAVISGNYLAFTPSTTNGGSTFTTPVFQLTPAGAATFSSSVQIQSSNGIKLNRSANDYYWQINSDASNYLNFGAYLSNGTAYGTNPKMILLDNGNVGIGTSSPAYPFDVKVATNAHWAISQSATGYASFRAGNDGYAAFVRGEIDASTLILNSQSGGNVGIAETSPSSKLSIGGVQGSTIGSNVALLVGNNGAAGTVGNLIQIGLHYNPAGATPASVIGAVFTSTAGYTKSDIFFATRDVTTDTAPTERMRITSGGNVLIGTTTDNGQGKLQVAGSLTAGGISISGTQYTSSSTLTYGYYHVFTGGSGQTLTLNSPSSNNFQYVIINNTSNSLTIAAASLCLIVNLSGSGVSSITLAANARCFIVADGGTKYYQIF